MRGYSKATVPDAPENLTATAGDGEVTLSWEAPNSDGGEEITGFQYRYSEGTTVTTTATWTDVGEVKDVTVSSLTNGTAYAFEVRAVNSVGGGAAARATATPVAAGGTNTPATGHPAITGAAQDGKTLTAGIGKVMDADGISSVAYQWVRVDPDGSSNETNVGTGSTYTLTSSDVGKKILVKASFTDDGGTDETRTSDAYPSYANVMAAKGTCPTTNTWCATLTSGYSSLSTVVISANFFGYIPSSSLGKLSPVTFTHGGTTYTVTSVSRNLNLQLTSGTILSDDLSITVTGDMGETLPDGTVLDVGGQTFTVDAASVTTTTGEEQWSLKDLGISFNWVEDGEIAISLKLPNAVPVITTTSPLSVAENTTAVATLAATDADAGDTLTWSKNGGADAGKFDVTDAGVLTFATAPNFESPTDNGADNGYVVNVRVSDGTAMADLSLTVNVTDVNEQPDSPDAPLVEATMGSHTSLDVSWTKPGLNGGPSISGYDLEYRPTGTNTWDSEPHTGLGTMATIDNLSSATEYRVRVRALNGETPSDWSSDVGSTSSATSADATLSGLTVSPRDIIGFAADRTDYEVGVASTVNQATVTATKSDPGATVVYSGTDAEPNTVGHQGDLSAGANEVTVTVTAADTTTTETYTVRVNLGVTDAYGWTAALDLDGLIAADNISPTGIRSDGATMWVVDASDNKIYAYNTDGTRDRGKDFDTLSTAGNTNATGIWSDGTTMWLTDATDDKIYAYNTDGTRDSGKDFDTLSTAGNNAPTGIWSDGTTMWVSDQTDDKLYAYQMSDQAHDSGKDLTLSAGNAHSYGIWSDGTTMWVSDWSDDKIYAYRMSDKARDSGKDFDTLAAAGNTSPYGIWSDGATMWVADTGDDKVYSYNMPPSDDATLSGLTVSPRDIIGFTADRTDYEVGVASTVAQATVTATANDPGATVVYSGTDAEPNTAGHQVDLSAGRNQVFVTVTSADTTTTEIYDVRVNRGVTDAYGWKAALDLDGLIEAGNDSPTGIWSDRHDHVGCRLG